MIFINKEKCIGCGACVKVCPFTVLRLDEVGAETGQKVKKAIVTQKNCLDCMHCASVCLQNAISYNNQIAATEKVLSLPENIVSATETLIKQRRSYRIFSKEKVPQSEIRKMIELSNLAPSAKNTHPTNWLVIDDEILRDKIMSTIKNHLEKNNLNPEILEELKNNNNPVIGQNASLLIGYCKNDSLDPIHDTAIALTTIELLMQSRGIGTCWGGYLMRYLNTIPECKKLINLPEDYSVFGTLFFGYPNQPDYKFVPARVHPMPIRFNEE